MKSIPTPTHKVRQQTILVIGFNVRPLAQSAKRAGYRVLAVDYWGDLDLARWADHYVAVLEQQAEHRPERPITSTAKALVDGAQKLLSEQGPAQHILVSGGFDDHPREWRLLTSLAPLAGNPVQTLIQSRNRKIVERLAIKSGAEVPTSNLVNDKKAFLNAVNGLSLPVVVKLLHGSGGFHSRVLRTEAEVERYTSHHLFDPKEPLLVQEGIEGQDASVSLLCTGKQARSLSVNEQLIGLQEMGKTRTKAYCGNIVPLHASPRIVKRLANIAKTMAEELQLVGSNGFDFVIDEQGTVFFMEINPRFQATIEAIEATTNTNLVRLHLNACEGQLPQRALKHTAYCSRIIVYAHMPCKIPDLRNIPGVVDIPFPGSYAFRGDPICTVNHLASTRREALEGAWGIVQTIYHLLRPLPSSKTADRN